MCRDCPHLEYINIPSSVKILDDCSITAWDRTTNRAGVGKSIVVFEMDSQIEKIGKDVFARQELYQIFLPNKVHPVCITTFIGTKNVQIVSPYLFNFCALQTKQTCKENRFHCSFILCFLFQFILNC